MEAPEYRALLAAEKAIAEVAAIFELVVHLKTARHEILDRLTTTSADPALLNRLFDILGHEAVQFSVGPLVFEMG